MYRFGTRIARCCRSAGRLTVASLVIGGLVASPALAVPKTVKRECRNDYRSFCPAYKVGTAKMRSCMRANGRQLSWGCYEALRDAGYVKGKR